MESNVTLKMEFKTPNVNTTLSLMQIVREGIEKLTTLCKHIHHVEVHLCDHESDVSGSKFALCKILSDKGDFTVQHHSSRYEDALLDAFDQACRRISAKPVLAPAI
jgi:hypothetical protein